MIRYINRLFTYLLTYIVLSALEVWSLGWFLFCWCYQGSKVVEAVLAAVLVECLICPVKSSVLLHIESTTWKLGCQGKNSGEKYVLCFLITKCWTVWTLVCPKFTFSCIVNLLVGNVFDVGVYIIAFSEEFSFVHCRFPVHRTAQISKVVVLASHIGHIRVIQSTVTQWATETITVQ